MDGPFYRNSEDLTPGNSVGYLARRISKLCVMEAERIFRDQELSFSQWLALVMIGHESAGNCAQLARALGHNSGATTRLVDQLEERGLIRRWREGEDRRVINVALTGAGQAMLIRLTAPMAGVWNELFSGFERAEVETMMSLMTRLMKTLEARVCPKQAVAQ